jgi:uncharacterized zinc-type alcohol dehydrogenase-like protein
MVLVGAVEPLKPFHGGNIIMGRKYCWFFNWRNKETQEMLDSVVSIILLVILNLSICKILKSFGRVTSDVKYRFVIDMKSLKSFFYLVSKTASKAILDAVFLL